MPKCEEPLSEFTPIEPSTDFALSLESSHPQPAKPERCPTADQEDHGENGRRALLADRWVQGLGPKPSVGVQHTGGSFNFGL